VVSFLEHQVYVWRVGRTSSEAVYSERKSVEPGGGVEGLSNSSCRLFFQSSSLTTDVLDDGVLMCPA